jgi:signal recognition particle subunit SRP54
LLDTAGRLHIDSGMLEELRLIDNALQPKYKILVLDAMTGQESLRVASAFDQGVGFNSAILTKMDSGTRAGAAFAFRYALKKQIIFVGMGEKPADLEPFRPERMANRILGMGDVLTLIEKAESVINKSDQDKAAKTFQAGKMTLQDFADQLSMINKMGSLGSIAQYLPGMGGAKLSDDQLQKGDKELKKFQAIISSMTLKERLYPKILDHSRKNRIAKGAGLAVADVNLLISRFDQMQQFAKLFKRFGR